ncbi:hypothetical protein [Dehalobacterium formicoaceticum]|uniref:Uncharacterized protein n=1 Tax=Dehalobacterium formicoaceticum TaxID=51515 RepID=A0ABT1Y7A3_9FIRM|nr:hypothetical protein [Dehalobacterium formicoaceticum]MCR6546764.1 hypothetical protein [Dehalobacterium formicoaceticum]
MEKIQVIQETINQIIEELQSQPFGLDVALEKFDQEKVHWLIRMKDQFVPITMDEINEKRTGTDSLYQTMKDLFMEKFQWLIWKTV